METRRDGFQSLVQVPTLDGSPLAGNQFFDPSYGKTYASEAGFEAAAVAGYALQFPPDVRGSYHVFTPNRRVAQYPFYGGACVFDVNQQGA